MTHDLEMATVNAEAINAEYQLTKKTSMAMLKVQGVDLDTDDMSPDKTKPAHKMSLNINLGEEDGTDKGKLRSKSVTPRIRAFTAPSEA